MSVKAAVIVAFLAVILIGGNAQPHKAKQAEAPQQPSAPVSSAAEQKQQNGTELQPEHEKHVQADVRVVETPKKDFYDKAPFWINAALAVAGFAGIAIGIWTLCYLRRQTHEMRLQRVAMVRSVNALRRQTQHMALSERAWVTVTPTNLSPVLYPFWEPGTPIPDDPQRLQPVFHTLPLTIKNVGKTPAQIDEIACRYVLLRSMSDLPDDPDYGELVSQGGNWITPGEANYGAVNLEGNNGILYERNVHEIKIRRAILFAFGILKYRDVYRNAHETRFGFLYTFPIPGTVAADGSDLKPQFRKDGPPKYNHAD